MTVNKDLRIKKTQRSLQEALLALINEKGFDAISVKDLTEQAEINRATFYRHYLDKYDLLDKNIDNMLLDLGNTVIPKNMNEIIGKDGEPSPMYVKLFEFIFENASFFRTMMSKNGISSFQYRLIVIMKDYINMAIDEFQQQQNSMHTQKEIVINYITYAIIGLINYWLESDMKYSPQHMAKQLSDIAFSGPLSTLGITKKDNR